MAQEYWLIGAIEDYTGFTSYCWAAVYTLIHDSPSEVGVVLP